MADGDMPISAIFLVSGRDAHGRPLARLLHQLPWFPAEPPQSGRVADTDGNDTGIAVLGHLAVTDEAWPLPAMESHPWDADMHARPPRASLEPPESPPTLPELAEGDLLLAERCRGWPDDLAGGSGDTVRVSGIRIIGRNLDAASASRKATAVLGLDDVACRNRLIVHGFGSLKHEADAERASRQPDEALFVTWTDDWGKTQSRVIASTGSWFFHDGEPDNPGFGDSTAPGIHFLANGRPWSGGDIYSGDFDCGIDGDIIAPEPEHLARMAVSAEDVRRLAADAMADILNSGQDPFAALARQGALLPRWAIAAERVPSP